MRDDIVVLDPYDTLLRCLMQGSYPLQLRLRALVSHLWPIFVNLTY